MVTLKDFFSFKNNRFFWLNLIAMVVVITAIIVGTLFWLDNYTHHNQSYLVPNVKNQTLPEAEQALTTQKLKGIVIDSSYVKGMPSGIILEQTPACLDHRFLIFRIFFRFLPIILQQRFVQLPHHIKYIFIPAILLQQVHDHFLCL